MEHFGTIVTLDLRGGDAAAARFADAPEVFFDHRQSRLDRVAGGAAADDVERDLTAEQVALSGVAEGTVRLSIGLEDIDDLFEDLTQALERAGN